MSSDRRRFVGSLVAGLGALALPGVLSGCARRPEEVEDRADTGGAQSGGNRLDAIGVQLYTLRTLLAKDFEGTLAALARIGYREVEFAGLYDRKPAAIRTILEREGLMGGPDVRGLTEMLGATTLDVIASGGVSSLDDLRALAAIEVGGRRLAGAIVGTAIYEGAVPVDEATEVLRCAPRG